MSSADTTAAAAGAAAAAAAAAPQASPSQSNATVQPLNNANNNAGGDSLICQWTACGERLPSPEQLYVSWLSSSPPQPSRRVAIRLPSDDLALLSFDLCLSSFMKRMSCLQSGSDDGKPTSRLLRVRSLARRLKIFTTPLHLSSLQLKSQKLTFIRTTSASDMLAARAQTISISPANGVAAARRLSSEITSPRTSASTCL